MEESEKIATTHDQRAVALAHAMVYAKENGLPADGVVEAARAFAEFLAQG